MTKVTASALVLLGFTCSGCAPKVVEKVVIRTKYVYEEPYNFQKVPIDGMYIDMGTKKLQKMCTPKMLEMNTQYREIIDYYDWQQDEYKRDRNTTKRRQND